MLTRFLAGCQWRAPTVAGLSRRLVSALDTWQRESQWLGIHLYRGPEGS